jgi:hypothetical protein
MSVTDDRPVDIDEARQELSAQMDLHRIELRRGVEEFTTSVNEFTRSFAPMRESPGLWIVGGFVLGLWLGSGRT